MTICPTITPLTALTTERRTPVIISGIAAGKVSVLDGASLQGENAVVTSAITLTPDEQKQIEAELKDKLGSAIEIAFQVDPGILGGIVVRVGEHEIDGSARRALETLQQTLI